MEKRTLHFFNDVRLSGKKTNVLTRKEMIRAFGEIDDIDNLVVHYVAPSIAEKRETVEELETDSIEARPVYLPGFSNKLSKNSVIGRIYKILVLNRLLEFFYFLRLVKTREDSISYIWGSDPSIAVVLSRIINSNSFLLELDDYMFGKDRLTDFIYLKAASFATKVSTVSEQTRKDLIERRISSDKIEVLPNAVNFNQFNLDESKTSIRGELDMPVEKFVVTYTGHLSDWKGVKTLVEAAEHLQNKAIEFVIVGGIQEDVARYREIVEDRGLDNVKLTGYVSREKIPLYQNSSDVLVVPNTAENEKSAKYTSPVKLREYMASNTPVIASELPSIKQAAGNKELFYFSPDDPEDLADKIIKIKKNPESATEKAENAFESVKEYSWQDRARKLVKDVF